MLKRLFEFNDFANQAYFDALKELMDFEKAFEWMKHIVEAQYIWNQRILNKTIDLEKFRTVSLDELRELHSYNQNETAEILNTVNLQEYISYTNLKGDAYKNKIEDILHHLINHSTYHRAQIATILKENRVKVPSTDYIFYVRKMGY